jgi:hypothetical protein
MENIFITSCANGYILTFKEVSEYAICSEHEQYIFNTKEELGEFIKINGVINPKSTIPTTSTH